MSSYLFDQYARRASALLDRAISERKIGYTVSARTTAERALVWASTDAERAEVANLLAECGTVAYRLHRGEG